MVTRTINDYTIPRNNRELQRLSKSLKDLIDYTIPRNNRELQPSPHRIMQIKIIPYQEIIGNYSPVSCVSTRKEIIPYQEIIGNYSGNDRVF